MRETSLRALVERRLDRRWREWAQAHPHLAEVIDRTKLVELSVEQLRQDPAFREAMRRAGLDEQRLSAAGEALEQAERLIGRLLPG